MLFKYKDIVKPDVTAWVSGCSHAFHKNICFGSSTWNDKINNCRPYDDELIMTDSMIYNINSKIKKDDVFFLLGDVAFGGHNNVNTFLSALNCENIYISFGNHDKQIVHPKAKYVGDYIELRMNDNSLVCMFHYPIYSWNEQHHGSIHLYSHVHGKLRGKEIGRSMDVGMDTNNMFPYKLSELVTQLKQIPSIFYRSGH
jgi:calcineurin-like phosphoesterase family protein